MIHQTVLFYYRVEVILISTVNSNLYALAFYICLVVVPRVIIGKAEARRQMETEGSQYHMSNLGKLASTVNLFLQYNSN